MSSVSVLSSGHSIETVPLYTADMALASDCARNIPGAIARFEAVYAADIRIVHARARGSSKPALDELAQAVRVKLFAGESPRIREYRGTGSLKNWVRVVATRTLIEMARATKDVEPIDDSGVVAFTAPDDDPEMAYLKRRYASEVKVAFEEAAKELSAEDRNVLREHYARGLSIDQIAAIHGVHRATAARRLVSAREAVLAGTRRILMTRLRLSRAELESVVRMVESRMHVTAERVFS
jgi:RNA polymerase sigma-70 factor (ECF subfamily)